MNLDEIRPALMDPNFDPSMAIVVLELPQLGIRDCRALPIETAIQVVSDIVGQLQIKTDHDWRQEIADIRAKGLTLVIKLWAIERDQYVEISGVEIKPLARA